MAGDWMKVEKVTSRKPEVLRIADKLGIHRLHAFGLCVEFWSWCDDQLRESYAAGVTEKFVDDIVAHNGFASALLSVGWLQVRSGSLEIPNFDRHLAEGAKSRALTAKRMKNNRAKQRNERDGASVTVASPEKRREEKSKEEIRNKESPQAAFVPPTVDEVALYCAERNNKVDSQNFVDFYESKGWMIGKNKMKDWRSCVRTWEKSDANRSSGTNGHSRERTRLEGSLGAIADWMRDSDEGGVRDSDREPLRLEANR